MGGTFIKQKPEISESITLAAGMIYGIKTRISYAERQPKMIKMTLLIYTYIHIDKV